MDLFIKSKGRLTGKDPIKYYNLKTQESTLHLVKFIQDNKELYHQIIELYNVIEEKTKAIIHNRQGVAAVKKRREEREKKYNELHNSELRSKKLQSKFSTEFKNLEKWELKALIHKEINNEISKNIKELSFYYPNNNIIQENCNNAIVCRKSALIYLITKELLAKKDSNSLTSPLNDLYSKKLNEINNSNRLFWYSSNYNKLLFQKNAAKTFQIIEDWFLEITDSLEYTLQKSPLDKIWRRKINKKYKIVDFNNFPDKHIEQFASPVSEDSIESLCLIRLQDCMMERLGRKYWEFSDIYGPIEPEYCKYLGISRTFNYDQWQKSSPGGGDRIPSSPPWSRGEW